MKRLPGERVKRQEAKKHKGNRGNEIRSHVMIPLFHSLVILLFTPPPFYLPFSDGTDARR